MKDKICALAENHEWAAVVLLFLYMGFEAWLGKTQKTRAGSVLEFVFNLFRRKKEFKMEKDLAQGNIGSKGVYDIEFKAGQLKAVVEADLGVVKAKLEVSIPAEAVLDKLAAAIPGQIDDAVLALIKTALKA